jgi:predicted dehydrogenase
MLESIYSNRRQMLSGTAAAGAALLAGAMPVLAQEPAPTAAPVKKKHKIGVISARIKGDPQRLNGHSWQFTSCFHEKANMEAVRKLLDPGRVMLFEDFFFNPSVGFGQNLWEDMEVTHYYEADPAIAALYTEVFPNVKVASSLEEMVKEVDCIWLGDASGYGEDHFDLVAPGLERGLPTFCDKPIGGSVAGTRKILEFARQHKAPLMSSSLFRHQWGTEEAVRRRDIKDIGKDIGELTYVLASQGGEHNLDRWLVYGHHPTWTVITLCGPKVEAVSMVEKGPVCHALITYADRMPGAVFCGHRNIANTYNSTSVYFQRDEFTYTPAIEGNYWRGHYYQLFNMQRVFRQMVKTGVEPVPHEEILAVTAVLHAGVKSLSEKSRLVKIEEVMA